MAEAHGIAEVLQKPFGKLGIISCLLFGFEQNIEDDFVCPCEHVQNIVTSVLYGGVPSVVSFFITYRVMDFFPQTDSRRQRNNTKPYKLLYSILTFAIWLFLCSFDGYYLTCAVSDWKGEYTETDTLKWCKPSGNRTHLLESEQKTQKLMAMFQDIGFCMIAVVFLVVAGFQKCQTNETNTDTFEMAML